MRDIDFCDERWTITCLVIGIGLLLVPISVVTYFSPVDLPNHILASAIHTGNDTANTGGFLKANWLPSPYILFYTILPLLLHLFDWHLATTILLSAYVIAVPVSIYWLGRELVPENRVLALAGLLFVYTYHYDYGFIPYTIGIPLVFAGWAIVARMLKRGITPFRLVLATVITLAVYGSHFICMGVYGLGVVILFFYLRYHNLRAGKKGLKKAAVDAAAIVLVFVPAVIALAAYFMVIRSSDISDAGTITTFAYAPFISQVVIGLVRVLISADFPFDALEFGVLGGLILVLLLLKKMKIRTGPLLIIGLLFVLLTMITPRHAAFGGWEHSTRIAIFGIIPLFLSLAARGRAVQLTIAAVILLLLVSGTIIRIKRDQVLDRTIGTYVTALENHIPPGSKILTSYHAYPDAVVPWLRHAIAYYHIDNGGFSPILWTSQEHVAGFSATIDIPRLSERWTEVDAGKFDEVAPYYEYYVVVIAESSLPAFHASLSDHLLHRDSICAIYDLRAFHDRQTTAAHILTD